MMQSSDVVAQNFEAVEKELKFWKAEAIFYKNKYLQLISNKRTLEEEVNNNDNKAKQARIFHLFKDPMLILPKNCKLNIIEYFKGKELLKLTEVSKTWKNEIESNAVLMDRNIKRVKLSIKNEFLKTDLLILTKNKRLYRHLELIDCFEEYICLIQRYASILESLTIKDSANFFRVQGKKCNFPKLRILTLHHFDDSWFSWLINCNFPNLEEFRYSNNLSVAYNPYANDWIESLSDIFCCMESVQNLYIRTHGAYGLNSLQTTSELTSIDVGYDFPHSFLFHHKETLTVLRAGCTVQHLSIILRNFKNLETFAIDITGELEEDDEEFEEDDEDCQIVSEEIVLKLHKGINNLIIQTEEPKIMRKVIDALPELTTLVTYNFFTKNDVEYLVYNAFNLNKVICRGGFQSYVLDDYERIQRYEKNNKDANTDFEIVLHEKKEWDMYDCIWDDTF